MSYTANYSYSPEQRLANAIFGRTLVDATLDRYAISRREMRQARHWLFEQPLGVNRPFTFRYTIDAINQDPIRVRKHLTRLWIEEPERLRSLVQTYLDLYNPLNKEPTYDAPLFAIGKGGQYLLFGELLAA